MKPFSLYASQAAFRVALCDSFDTPTAINVLRDLVSRTNVYINTHGKDLNVELVGNVARWIGQMLRMFGLGEGERRELGWGQIDEGGGSVDVRYHYQSFFVYLTDFACTAR